MIKETHKSPKFSYWGSFKRHFEMILIGIPFYLFAIGLKHAEMVSVDERPFSFNILIISLAILPFIYKNFYFLISAFQKISDTIDENVNYVQFLTAIFISIFLIIFSFSIDFVFLFYYASDSIVGIYDSNVFGAFFYCFFLSASIFLNLGFSDIIPHSLAAKTIVLIEMGMSVVFMIGIVANFSGIRDVFREEPVFKKK